MRQFILPEDWEGGPECLIEGGRASYLSRVLRLAPGDSFAGLDARGARWLCRVVEAAPTRVLLGIEPLPPGREELSLPDARGGRASGGRAAAPLTAGGRAASGRAAASAPVREGAAAARPFPPITLVQGLPKASKMDLIVRQAAEAGVARILPLFTGRSIPRGSEGGRLARWERIIREGLQQSGSAVPTRVSPPVGLDGLAAALGPPAGRRIALLLHEAPLEQASLHRYLVEAPDEIVLCVGPEGGFAPEETDFLLGLGFSPLRLAGAVLRTETAALYAVAAVETILSERSSWIPKAP